MRPPLRVDVDERVAVVTLDRPEVLNAFSGEMGRLLDEAYRRCDADDDVRVVVLTGAGRAFCSGADFSAGSDVFRRPASGDFRSDPLEFHAWEVRKPTIAAVNGHAMGIGLTMTMHCDLRLVAADAKLGFVQVRRGVMPDLRSHWVLPRLVGHARALDLLLTGRVFSGTEAARWGLATEALAGTDVLGRAMEVARDIATHVAPLSAAVSKRLLWRPEPADSDEIDRLESALHRHLLAGPDAREGIEAYLDRRDPDWQMRLSADWPEGIDGFE